MSAIRDRSVVRSSVMPSAKYWCSRSSLRLVKRRDDDRKARRGKGLRDRHRQRNPRSQLRNSFGAQRIGPHLPRDVLDGLLAQILERVWQLVADLVAHCPRDPDPAGFGERFQARGDVDPVAEDVVVLSDDVTEVNANAELDPQSRCNARVPLSHPRCISTAQRTASTTLANSAKKPSPVFLTTRGLGVLPCSDRPVAMCAWSRSCAPSSSAPISRE